MKNLFLIACMVSATTLCASESLVGPCDASIGKTQVSLQEEPTIPSEGLECGIRFRRHRRHSSSHRPVPPVLDSVAYGSFYTEGGGTELIIPFGSIIPLRNVTVSNNTFLNLDGTISLAEAGDYFIEFGASVTGESTAIATIGLALNGDAPQPGSNIALPTPGQLTTASTILRVAGPSILSLVNISDTFALSPTNVNAFVSVSKLNNLPRP